ncbi:hypothetical protein [Sinorhizobium fredii]|uniref:hypothetical protein n=1 Tax=Rhizobium fredii TaxID=380 RepID=UPI0004B3B202|nr:hypothetical protein [Sinorhizobium fredii]AWI60338.1 hypothetical protein AB395_00005161 [Sinorhizobium fredii CCBAU 45436]
MTPSLNNVYSVSATEEEGVYILECNITDMQGDTYDAEYVTRPDDSFGLNPTIRQWLSDNPEFPIEAHVPPTIEEIRAAMRPLTARQLRLGLVSGSFSLAQVDAAIEAMPEGVEKETARIEWEYATTFKRTHPLIGLVGAALGLDDTEIDAMWTASLSH